MREGEQRETLRRRPGNAAMVSSRGRGGVVVPTWTARPSLPARAYFRFEGVQEILRAFLEKTDPQGPDTLGELARAIWHRLTGDSSQPSPVPGEYIRTVGNPELAARATGKAAHVLALATCAVAAAIAHRIRQAAGAH